MRKLLLRFIKDESGQSLVVAALFLVVLLGMAALVIDVGYMQYQKRYLQNTADAAALAAAGSINEFSALSSTERDNHLRSVAHSVVKKNLGDDFPIEDITVDLSDIEANQVTVTLGEVAPRFFAGVLNLDASSVRARSKAEAMLDSKLRFHGTGLPFANVYEPYATGNTFHTIGNSQTAGFFNRIEITGQNSETHQFQFQLATRTIGGTTVDVLELYQGNPQSMVNEGTMALAAPIGSAQYLFSIKSNLIDAFLATNPKKNEVHPSILGNGTNTYILLSDLVLLEVMVEKQYLNVGNSGKTSMELQVLQEHEIQVENIGGLKNIVIDVEPGNGTSQRAARIIE